MACIKVFNIIDTFLDDKNAPVVLSASKLFYAFINHLTSDSSGILRDFIVKISPQITRFLKGNSNQEFQLSVMVFLSGLSDEAFDQLTPLLNQFYFKPKDNVKIRKLKAEVLFRFCKLELKKDLVSDNNKTNGNNASVIIDYLLSQLQYQTSIRDKIVHHICQLAFLSTKSTSDDNCRMGNKIIQNFAKILISDDDGVLKSHMTKLILINMRSLPLNPKDQKSDEDRNCNKKLLDILCKNFLNEKQTFLHNHIFHHQHLKDGDDTEAENVNVVINFLWMLHTYTNKIEDCPYILEEVVDFIEMNEANQQIKRKGERNHSVLSRLLVTSVKCFQVYPAETQHILGKVFELCKNQNSPELEEKVVFYGKLLQCDSFYSRNNSRI